MYDLTTGEKRCRTSEVLAEEGDLILPNEVTGEISSEVSGAARRQIEALLDGLSSLERTAVRQYFGLDGEVVFPRGGHYTGAEQEMPPPLVERAMRRLQAI